MAYQPLSTAQQSSVDSYRSAERNFVQVERLYVKGDLPLSAWRQANSSAQFAYDLCIDAGIDPFTSKQ
jgi:hypothetical protein